MAADADAAGGLLLRRGGGIPCFAGATTTDGWSIDFASRFY